jgi:hypothetical protein
MQKKLTTIYANAILSCILLVLSIGMAVYFLASDRSHLIGVIVAACLGIVALSFFVSAAISLVDHYKRDTTSKTETHLLHIYGQYNDTNPVYIVGDEVALKSLKKALEQAIEIGWDSTGRRFHASDEERFEIRVICPEDSETVLKSLALPYVRKFANAAKEQHELLHPNEMWTTYSG